MAPVRERILITVKTYPTLSTRYGETVCTAGVRDDGSWIRLYPVPFRRLEFEQQYSKFDLVECRVTKHTSDPRPESFRPIDNSELIPVGSIGTEDRWRERRRLILREGAVADRLAPLIDDAHANRRSLTTFRPTQVLDLVIEEDEEREWDPERVRLMREATLQTQLFDDDSWRETFSLLPKLPYRFSYRFEDADGRQSTLTILDWEIGALFWNCMRSEEGNEERALQKVRQKYVEQFFATDLHFFLGTTQEWHQRRAPNPWVIIGVFPAPQVTQLGLF